MELPRAARKQERTEHLSGAETELLVTYRRLPPKYQRRLREHAEEYKAIARVSSARERQRRER
jgi:hypothetical protein